MNDAENRKLAEWLGSCVHREFTERRAPDSYGGFYTERRCQKCHELEDRWKDIPDFYRDEAANALIRRKLRSEINYMVIHRENGKEIVRFVPKLMADPIVQGEGETDLEAICQAALKRIEQGEE